MESRKVQLTGNSTYTVSLPKPWATAQGIEAGQEVSLYTYGDESLVLKPDAAGPDGELCASVLVPSISDASLAMAVSSLYVGGYDRITLHTDGEFSAAQRRAVIRKARALIGLEVVEIAGRIELQNLLDPGEVSVRQTLIQLRMTVLSNHRIAVDSVLEADTADGRLPGAGEADRLHALLGRTFRRSLRCIEEIDRLDVDPGRLFDYYAAATQLERVGTIAAKTAARGTGADSVPPASVAERVQSAGEHSRNIVERAVTAIVDGSVDPAYEALERHRDLASDIDALDRELAGADLDGAYHLGVLIDAIRRTGESGVGVARVALQSPSRDGPE